MRKVDTFDDSQADLLVFWLSSCWQIRPAGNTVLTSKKRVSSPKLFTAPVPFWCYSSSAVSLLVNLRLHILDIFSHNASMNESSSWESFQTRLKIPSDADNIVNHISAFQGYTVTVLLWDNAWTVFPDKSTNSSNKGSKHSSEVREFQNVCLLMNHLIRR